MMNKKAQVIIISLWILILLTMLAIGVSRRVSLALRLSRYQRDSLKALCLAKAGINRAIKEIIEDKSPYYDSLSDNWANNESVFEKIIINEDANDFASVYYANVNENREPNIIYGVMDEERLININTANQNLLKALLENCQVTQDQETLTFNIRAWRGDKDVPFVPEEAKRYDDLGYPCKEAIFANIEELNLVKGFAPEIYQKVKDLITTFGRGKININTAPEEILKILCSVAVNNLQGTPGTNISQSDAEAVVEEIIAFRNNNKYFNINEINTESIRAALGLGTIEDDNRTKIINELITLQLLNAVSENLRIESTGNADNITKKITATYDRTNRKIISWHEN